MEPVALSTHWDFFNHKDGYTEESLTKAINVPGVPNSCAAWNGHEFEIPGFSIDGLNRGKWFYELRDLTTDDVLSYAPYETTMIIVFPVDPRTNSKDWKGATQAYHNETQDGWLPSHCDNDFHQDHELNLTDVIVSVFQPEIDILRSDVETKLATLVRNSSDSSAGSRELAARLKLDNMIKVRGHLIECAIKDTREKYVGYYHQNPKDSHLRDELIDCIDNGLSIYRAANEDAYTSVSTELGRILTNLKTKHNYKTRWRLEAEKKAAAAAAASSSESSESDSQSE